MTLYRENPPNVFRPWAGEKIGGVWHPPEIETAWPDEELEALKLFKPEGAEEPAPGRLVVSTSVKRVDGVVRFVHDLAAITPDQLVAYAKDRRWQKETGGIVVAGILVATDDRSKQMIIGARVAADADPLWSTKWEGRYPLNAAAMVMISNAVQAHVNDCFTIYGDVLTGIEGGAITTFAAIDEAFS